MDTMNSSKRSRCVSRDMLCSPKTHNEYITQCNDINCPIKDSWDCRGECKLWKEDTSVRENKEKLSVLNNYRTLVDTRLEKYKSLINDLLLNRQYLKKKIDKAIKARDELKPTTIREKIDSETSELEMYESTIKSIKASYIDKKYGFDEDGESKLEDEIQRIMLEERPSNSEIVKIIDYQNLIDASRSKINSLTLQWTRCLENNNEYKKRTVEIENDNSNYDKNTNSIPIVNSENREKIKNLIKDGNDFSITKFYLAVRFLSQFFSDVDNLISSTTTQNAISPHFLNDGRPTPDENSPRTRIYSEEINNVLNTKKNINQIIRDINFHTDGLINHIYDSHKETIKNKIEKEGYEFYKKYRHRDEYHQYMWDNYESKEYKDSMKSRVEAEKNKRLEFLEDYENHLEGLEEYYKDRLNRQKEELKKYFNRHGIILSKPSSKNKIFTIRDAFVKKRLTSSEFMKKNHRAMTFEEKEFDLEIENMENTFQIQSASERRIELEDNDANNHQIDDYEEPDDEKLTREERIKKTDLKLTREEILHNLQEDKDFARRELSSSLRESRKGSGPRSKLSNTGRAKNK